MLVSTTVVLLFVVAMAVALAVRAVRVPYTVALVIVGLVLGRVLRATAIVPAPTLTKDLLYALFLPGLLFEAALNLDVRAFWQNKLAIIALAVPGVVVSTVATAAMLLPFGATWVSALAFASAVSATDPVAVVAMLKEMRTPLRMRVTLEAESLLNDGTASVLFLVIIAFATHESRSIGAAALQLAWLVVGGVLIGLVVGFGLSRIIRRIDDVLIELSLTVIAAYGSFVIAEQLRASGILATVAAGMLSGSYGVRGMSERTRVAVDGFWSYVAFALNSIIFLLIGFTLRPGALLDSWKPIALAYFAVIAARALVVLLVSLAVRGTRERLPARWGIVLTWGGLRGALSMVLALALPADFPHRDTVVSATFGVVLASTIVNGLTMGAMIRATGLGRELPLQEPR